MGLSFSFLDDVCTELFFLELGLLRVADRSNSRVECFLFKLSADLSLSSSFGSYLEGGLTP
jgi:hypothetical protein